MNSLYSLTEMTGRRAGSNRTRVVGTVEMKNRTFWVLAISLLPGMAVAAVFAPVLREWSLVLVPAVMAVAAVLFNRRQRDGLQLYTFMALRDKYGRGEQDKLYQLVQGHRPLDISQPRLEAVVSSSAAVPAGVGTGPAAARYDDELSF